MTVKRVVSGRLVAELGGQEKEFEWFEITPDSLLAIYENNMEMMSSVPEPQMAQMFYDAFVYAYLSNSRKEAARIKARISKLNASVLIDWNVKKEQLLPMGV